MVSLHTHIYLNRRKEWDLLAKTQQQQSYNTWFLCIVWSFSSHSRILHLFGVSVNVLLTVSLNSRKKMQQPDTAQAYIHCKHDVHFPRWTIRRWIWIESYQGSIILLYSVLVQPLKTLRSYAHAHITFLKLHFLSLGWRYNATLEKTVYRLYNDSIHLQLKKSVYEFTFLCFLFNGIR